MEKSLRLTSTGAQNTVHAPAPAEPCQGSPQFVRIAEIKPLEREDVYNMEVEHFHNFSVNGGYIVHNSIDAVRYALERVWKRKGQ